ncbi:thiol reductant ABC exporter subunit CydD [Devosia sp. BSSL-BM10]|uniref:Thiol reductant ABC exporter subunit CydD n=1 Tax=Devosia litorisediminis TaxID=2829817 RepID=A0A942IEC2_9HYPH|nr:thiol reductant ABC exporter subunit CydD [Devosia litorisediminis]MBS3849205.1 thiol reductant ABC exporter subunit CydD [Devosia litorisediminis]
MPKTSTSPAAPIPPQGQPTVTSPDRQNAKTLSGLRRFGGPWLWLAIAAPLLGGVLLVVQAWTLAGIVGGVVENGAVIAAMTPGIVLIFGLLLTRAALAAIGDRAGTAASEAIKTNLRQALFAQLLSRSPRAADQPHSGAASSAMIDQVEALDGFFARYVPAMVQASLLPLAFGAIILPLDWLAGLLFLVTAPLIPVFMALVGWGAQYATDRQARALSLLNGRFADRLRGLTTLKLFGRAEAETAGIVAASDELRHRTLRVLRIAFLSSAVLEFFAALGVAGIALYVGLTFIDFLHLRSTPLTLELGLFLLLMAPEVYNPLRLLAAHYHDRASAKSAIGEIQAQLGALPAEIVPLGHAEPSASPDAMALRLDKLTLRTPDNARVILHETGLNIKAGEHVAIVGQSGIGKSSLLEAIARMRPHGGAITLGDQPLEDWDEAELRHSVAMLGQKPRIFAGSMADNIAMARPDATPAQIRSAAERAQAAGFADALPEGLDTLLGEGGLGLSGGQTQRIALARIFLRDPGLILLDEPTAHLDAELEQAVLDALLDFAHGRTLIIATHSQAVAKRMHHAYRIAGAELLATPVSAASVRSVA